MSGIMDLVLQSVAGGTGSPIGRKLGLNDQSTNAALSAALPLLLSALTRNTSTPEGAGALHQALQRDHDGSLLDNLGGLLGGGAGLGKAGDGAGILGHLLGDRRDVATQAVARAGGIDAGQAGALLAMLAPVVMGALGKAQRQGGLDAGGLAGMLAGEQQRVAQAQPDLLGMANRLLDRDGDGSALDDVMGGLGKLFGGR